MISALPAIARIVLYGALKVVLVLAVAGAVLSAVLWAAYGPQDSRLPVWLAATFVTITGAGLGLVALRPRPDLPQEGKDS